MREWLMSNTQFAKIFPLRSGSRVLLHSLTGGSILHNGNNPSFKYKAGAINYSVISQKTQRCSIALVNSTARGSLIINEADSKIVLRIAKSVVQSIIDGFSSKRAPCSIKSSCKKRLNMKQVFMWLAIVIL